MEVKMVTDSNTKQSKNRKIRKAIVSKAVKDYGNDPFFVKKANESQKFLEKHGFPIVQKKK